MEKLRQAAGEETAVQLWAKGEQVALVLKRGRCSLKKVWSRDVLVMLDAPPASPEKMMIETAQEMARALTKMEEADEFG